MSNKNELIITRIFDAPPSAVFMAWTEPERIKKWWGPQSFTCPVAKVDLRKGGKYVYCMHGTEGAFAGKDFWSGGEFREVDAPNKIVVTDYFCDEKGDKVDPATFGMDPNFPKESAIIIKFEEDKGKTRLSIIYELPKSAATREAMTKSGMNEGWNSSLDKLQTLVEKRNEI